MAAETNRLLVGCVWILVFRSSSCTVHAQVYCADPTVLVSDSAYYLTGTNDMGARSFSLYKSHDLRHWSLQSVMLDDNAHSWGESGFWAPQIMKANDKYLLFYTANEQIAVAESEHIGGGYRQQEIQTVGISEKNIDPFLFRDDDGKYYLFHVRFNKGNYIWVAEFDIDKKCIKQETQHQCFRDDQPWENTGAFPSDPVMEGPTVIKLKGKYYMFYSANHFMSKDYAMGYAVADSPEGPWRKAESNPIIHQSITGEPGSGHGDVFYSGDQLYYVYHIHYSDTQPTPRKTRIVPLHYTTNSNEECDFFVEAEEIIRLEVN